VITSPAGRAMIEGFEGIVLTIYKDIAGYATIGVGHKLVAGEDYPNGITREQADALLANDLRVVDGCINSNVHNEIGQNMHDACASLAFNIGTGAFLKSSVVRLMNTGDYLRAADAILLWDKFTDPKSGQLVVSATLMARREAERAVFLRDVSTLDVG
jgi:lysozyme